jgi:hypothetical protein
MSNMRISIASTAFEWMEYFGDIERDVPLAFYNGFGYPSPDIQFYKSETLPELGVASTGVLVLEPFYVVCALSLHPQVREVLLNSGERRYFADPDLNKDAFVFRPGGIYNSKYFIIGEISTISNECKIVKVLNKMNARIRKKYHRGNGFWISPECYRLYNESRIFTVDYRVSPQVIPGVNSRFT